MVRRSSQWLAVGLLLGTPLLVASGDRVAGALAFGAAVLVWGAVRQAEAFFGRHGDKVVAVAPCVESFRQLNGIVAGVSKMAWWRFLLFNILGAALWVGVWGSFGYFFGDSWAGSWLSSSASSSALSWGSILLVALAIAHKLFKRRREERGS